MSRIAPTSTIALMISVFISNSQFSEKMHA